MQVKDIMTKKVIFVSPETKITEVAEILTKNRFHGLPVVENNAVVGIIVENDFFTKNSVELHLPSYINFLKKTSIEKEISGEQKDRVEKLLDTKAKDIMTPNCSCLSPELDLERVIDIFKESKFNTFPVVDEGKKLLGIITLADLISLI